MLKVILEGHDNFYGLADIVRLFYGPCREDRENGCLVCDQGPDETIVINADPSTELPLNRQVKRDLYVRLKDLSGMSFPWGCLTGIRPTAVASEEDYDYRGLVSKYLVREDKAKLACQTGKLESRIEQEASGRLNIYAGVPFCPGRCEYCSFIAQDAVRHMGKLHEYAGALCLEADMLAPFIKEAPGTIYMGGGTPTVFDEDDFGRVIECLSRSFRAGPHTEFTVEAGRPDTITEGKLDAMRSCGVNRICINPQTMNDATLRRINRGHTSADIISAYELARRKGFDVINMDIIAGLKYETAKDFTDSVRAAAGLDPENITIHTLYKKRRAGMSREDVLNAGGRGDIDKAVSEAYEYLNAMGYVPYYMYRQKDTELGLENVGFCKPGTYNRYNVAMMSYTADVLSAGAGGMSKRAFRDGRYERCGNVKDISAYIKQARECAEKKIAFFELGSYS